MTPLRILFSLALLLSLSSTAQAQNGCARLSWGTCDPWVENNCWQGPGLYQLVYSVSGANGPVVGSDTQILVEAVTRRTHCFEGYPDAWRFGDGQCEGPNRISMERTSNDLGCPLLQGDHPDLITSVFMVGDVLNIRLAETHDAVTVDPSRRYTLWVITFDLTHASVGPSPADLSSCGDVDQYANFEFQFANLLTPGGQYQALSRCDSDPNVANQASATWNGGWGICDEFGRVLPGTNTCGPVPTQPTTWGRVKSLYR
jgi:hypothetical protein